MVSPDEDSAWGTRSCVEGSYHKSLFCRKEVAAEETSPKQLPSCAEAANVPISRRKAYLACDGIEPQVHALPGMSFCNTLPLPHQNSGLHLNIVQNLPLAVTCYSCRRPGFGSKHPYEGSLFSKTLIPGNPMPSSGLAGDSCITHIYRQTHK